jgi:NAD-dependent dihydropyrimidine dehydrogenase PreA subunit
MVYIDSERCTGCGACVEVCPTGAIQLAGDAARRYAEIHRAACRECRACIQVCPAGAIQVGAEPAVKGELVLAQPGTVQEKTRLRELQPVRPALTALAWAAPVLAFVGHEIVPRVAASLLDVWDRRASGSTATLRVPDDPVAARSVRQPAPSPRGAGRRRHRWRGGQGRW